jgi:carbamoyltransferase
MKILGVSQNHNSSICLIENGEIKLHIDNERISGKKYDSNSFEALKKIKKFDYLVVSGFSPDEKYNINYEKYLKELGHSNFKTINVWSQHHLFHASSSFYNSGFEKALCIVIDGMGSEYYFNDKNFTNETYGREQKSTYLAEYPCNFKEIDKNIIVNFDYNQTHKHINVSNDISEALWFEITSKKLGFTGFDSGKVMALAAYGKINEYQIIKNKNYYNIDDLRNPYLKINFNDNIQNIFDFCKNLQEQTQNSILEYINKMIKKTNIKNVCLSGGYFLNCVANEYFRTNLKDVNLYVEPISNDSGQSIGAAKYFWHFLNNDNTIRKQKSLYYGLNYNYKDDEIENTFKNFKVVKSNTYEIAKLISENNLIGVYGNRSESGPRALGNRSLLYNPTCFDGQKNVNKIKKREFFRPFACSILIEDVKNYFEIDSSPHMMYAVKSKNLNIPAVLHIDKTCRLQTVSKEDNEYLYNIIKDFKSITGIPLVLNTSFNLSNKPIVETLNDVKYTLINSSLKYVYFYENNLLIMKND